MIVAQVYVEYSVMALNQSYTYDCNGFFVKKGMRVLVDFAHKQIVGFVSEVKEVREENWTNTSYELKPILAVIDSQPLINDELFSLAQMMAKRYVAPLISCLQVMLPSKLKPKSNNQKIKMNHFVVFDKEVELKGKRQREALAYIKENKECLRSEFNRHYATQLSILLEKKAVHLESREARAILLESNRDKKITLTKDQKNALDQMSFFEEDHVFLLHGVTGSGKTEVFLQQAEKVISSGKQVLFLVPEIGLTPQMEKRVKARFGKNVAIYHSSLNNQEKYEQYRLVSEGRVNVVVGTRSAIFMPFTKLGLIVLDEEHDQSYKQESSPRYHARDIALWRAQKHRCQVLLASATPSLESYARAIKGVYTLIKMPNRIYGEMPNTQLINMQDALRNGENFILSNALKQSIEECLSRNEQCILLLNRRGYAPMLRCLDCGEVVKCPHCDLALNYHKSNQTLRCHVCGYEERTSSCCKKCGSTHLSYQGIGTQKLEEYIKQCFPLANIVRMDADTTQKKNAHKQLLKAFAENGDILLGTQMIAKGLDFENVTLVGIINGDAMLARNDYRSVELMFDLLVQASGRSGRSRKDGRVMIQVYDSEHYAIQCAARHDYESFFIKEMQYRHLAGYPPYRYLGSLLLSGKERNQVLSEMEALLADLQQSGIIILGPIELLRKMDLYRWRIILKGKDEQQISNLLYHAYQKQIEKKGKAKVEIDINPLILD